jgi:hypothetical protein
VSSSAGSAEAAGDHPQLHASRSGRSGARHQQPAKRPLTVKQNRGSLHKPTRSPAPTTSHSRE